ncbi:enoyl-CoA hydratase/carnithine racemase [Variovorax boronicumulans]|uniref:oxepin-CoA hydrolase, alternative type n=1 Tax=Variovorax boronicumulans TaxID=436515 RepID=UPI0024766A11|nr:enoyl-CoA hydratase [Variovorax boronicumulans]MDH6165076.1 enoyl-CoA hydratase/carnithine racemase [Variovorax boronicumulans]
MTAELKSTSEGSTMVLTIANPTQRNALGPEIYAAGIEALNGAESSSEIRSVVIVGEGAWFCAGGSLQRLMANRELDRSVQAESIEGLHNWIDSIRTFPKPIIAAVEGAAAGAGFSLALACDFVVAARDAVFAASYSNVALSPDGGLSWHLGQQLPRQLASEWLMNGERIGAPRLHAAGLVNELTESGQALAGALSLAKKLNARAPNSLASIKELLSEARSATLAAQLSQERDHFVRNLHHANAGIGIAAFLEKKPPQYE